MGKRNKFREARRLRAERHVSALLVAHSRREPEPAAPASYRDFDFAYRSTIERYREFAIRPPETWRCRIKSRQPERQFMDLVKFSFAKYPVAAHLENVWADVGGDAADATGPPVRVVARDGEVLPDLHRWYIVVAQGGSLYKQAASPFLSKLETHYFLTAPAQVTSINRAFWYAFARAQTEEQKVAVRVAQTRLHDFPIVSAFWNDVARYFARNPTTVSEMDDLIDFFRAALAEQPDFSLKGRSLLALRRRMEEWHRALRKQQSICGGVWPGRPIPDVEYEAGSEDKKAVWRFKQIKTGNDLYREGQRMHHCVGSYKTSCERGEVSIWSLICEFPFGNINRGVTLEVRKDGDIVQCRGYANRLPYANEVAMVQRWAREYGLTWRAITR